MKKILWLILLILPIIVLAYSDYIIPGGETLGIEVNSKGIVIIGFYKVDGKSINTDLQVGDKIMAVNGDEVLTTEDLIKDIDKYMEDDKVLITYERNKKEYNDYLELVLYNGTYRTGLYVKSGVLGIGTLSYIDPETKVYGVLGHGLNLSETQEKIDIRTGYSYEALVTSFKRSTNGNPGSKNANINKEKIVGTIERNSNYGIFGLYNEEEINKKKLKVGKLEEVNLGKAYIYTTNLDNEVEEYEIEILEIDKKHDEKNIYFEVTDKELLNMSGGIVQGMSGSPIIQNDMIVGAVTRVLVDDVTNGYGISIVKMLEEGDNIIE